MTRNTLEQLYAAHKGKVSDKWTLYFSQYEQIFENYRDDPVRLLEIGVQNGGSLEIWSKYFLRALNLVGCDINPVCASLSYEDPRIAVVVGDANSDAVQAKILRYAPAFDVIIDDGSHRSSDIVKSFARYFPILADGGVFVAEDLHCSYWQEFEGGLFDPFSSITFFKRLADVVSHEHWGIDKACTDILRGFFSKYSFRIEEETLRHIHSIEFFNSMCVIRKAKPERSRLGARIVAGSAGTVVPADLLRSSPEGTPDQTSNEWTARNIPPDEELLLRIMELAERDAQIAKQFEQAVHAEMKLQHALNTISDLRDSRSWKITRPLRVAGRIFRLLRNLDIEGIRRLSTRQATLSEAPATETMMGCLDTPRPNSCVEQNALTVKGWLFSKDTPIDSLSITVDGQPEVLAAFGYSRPDVAQANPEFPNARMSGFAGIYPLALVKPGRVSLLIWATLQDGRRLKCFERRIVIRAFSAHRKIAPLLFEFLQSSARKAWRAYREGRLPRSPSFWLLHLRRDYRMMLGSRQFLSSPTARPRAATPHDSYQQWMDTNRLTAKLLLLMKTDASQLMATGPTISVIVPIYNTPPAFLEGMIGSVVAQIYPKWELCLADDASTQPHVRETLERMASDDNRIRVIHRNQNGHIAEATNSALDIASGEYIALLDHDDVLSQDALLHVAECISRNPAVDWIYTDEDKIDKDGRHYDPQFKGEWSPEMAITHNFTHHLTVIRKSLVDRVGRMRKGFEGAQDIDLFLRVAEDTSPERIKHIPHVCYHWRSHEGSTASHGAQKRYIFDSAYRAIDEALKRRGLKARPFLPPFAERHGMCLHQLRWDLDDPSTKMVTIIIPTKDRVDLLERCVASLQKTVNDQLVKLLIVDDRSSDPRTLQYFEKLESEQTLHCRVIHPEFDDEKFNYARLMNQAAMHVDTPYMLQLNNDIEAINPGWLEEMKGWMSIDGVGAVGARLIYPNGNIQHGGVIVGPHGGLADHQFHLLPLDEVGYMALPHAARNVSAVTGACLLTTIELYRQLGGFDEEKFAVEYNDVDFCLRVIASGKRIVYTPQATLAHLTSASRGRDYNPDEHINFIQKYNAYQDAFFNENIQIDSMRMAVDPHHFTHANRARKLNILIISHNLSLGGAQIVVYELARHFASCEGYQVSVVSPTDGPIRERYEILGIPVNVLSDFPSLHHTSVVEFRDYLKCLGGTIGLTSYDLVVSNTLIGFWGVDMARMFGIPSIWHIHESMRINNACGIFSLQYLRPLLYSGFMSANRVVFQAEATRELFDEANARDNFCTIPGGVPLEKINSFRATISKSAIRAKYGVGENCTVITIVGTTCERKGQHVFLEAVKELEKRYPNGFPDDMIFVIVGAIKGPYLDFLCKRRDQLGLEKVRIFDETKDIYDFYALSDIFVCASFEESFPMVVLLAMAFELKIISTDVFGIPEIISDGHEGRLVKPGNPAALGKAIYACLNDSELSDRMARKAYAKACRLFDNRKLLDRHLALAKQVSLEEPLDKSVMIAPSEYTQAVSSSGVS